MTERRHPQLDYNPEGGSVCYSETQKDKWDSTVCVTRGVHTALQG